MTNKEIYDECMQGINMFSSIAQKIAGVTEANTGVVKMTNNYMTAEQVRYYSTKKLIDDFPEECKQELIKQIERTAMSGERSIIFIDEVFSVESFAPYLKKGYRQFLESLGYKVELNSTVINVNEKTVASHCLEISW